MVAVVGVDGVAEVMEEGINIGGVHQHLKQHLNPSTDQWLITLPPVLLRLDLLQCFIPLEVLLEVFRQVLELVHQLAFRTQVQALVLLHMDIRMPEDHRVQDM